MPRQFTLSIEDEAKIKTWREQQDKLWVESQKLPMPAGLGTPNEPYYGAIGGSLTYEFTPNSLGCTFIVRHATGNELDLTDYDSW